MDVTKEIKWEERRSGMDNNVDRSRKSSVLHVEGLVTNVWVHQPCSSLPLPVSTAVTAYQHCINVSLYWAWLYSPTHHRKRRQEEIRGGGDSKTEERRFERGKCYGFHLNVLMDLISDKTKNCARILEEEWGILQRHVCRARSCKQDFGPGPPEPCVKVKSVVIILGGYIKYMNVSTLWPVFL